MANEFKSNVGDKVSKKEAMDWIEKYDKEMRKDKSMDTKSLFYGKDVLLKILNDGDTAGITFFFGLRYNEAAKKDTVQLILVATKEDGTLSWTDDESVSRTGGGAVAYDGGYACPPYCPK